LKKVCKGAEKNAAFAGSSSLYGERIIENEQEA